MTTNDDDTRQLNTREIARRVYASVYERDKDHLIAYQQELIEKAIPQLETALRSLEAALAAERERNRALSTELAEQRRLMKDVIDRREELRPAYEKAAKAVGVDANATIYEGIMWMFQQQIDMKAELDAANVQTAPTLLARVLLALAE